MLGTILISVTSVMELDSAELVYSLLTISCGNLNLIDMYFAGSELRQENSNMGKSLHPINSAPSNSKTKVTYRSRALKSRGSYGNSALSQKVTVHKLISLCSKEVSKS